MIWALLAGAGIGSIPTADAVARARGVDLRTRGSGNPGTANALRVGGAGMAALVLCLDLVKGAAAALTGWLILGPAGAAAAGLAAVATQIANPWYRFRGGKGLGVTAGVSLVAWPIGLGLCLPVIAFASRMLGSARGALVAIVTYAAVAGAWVAADLDVGWGIPADARLLWLAGGVSLLTTPKFAATVRSGV